MAAGLPNVQWIEYFMPDNALLAFQTKLFTGPALREEVTPEGVFLLAPEAPGIGLKLDPAIAEASRVRDSEPRPSTLKRTAPHDPAAATGAAAWPQRRESRTSTAGGWSGRASSPRSSPRVSVRSDAPPSGLQT